MLKFIGRHILTGLATILPVALTLYLLYWFAISAENILGGTIRLIIPDDLYWPGMGLVIGFGVIFLIGVLMHGWVFQRLFAWAEKLIYHMPLVKSVYGAIRDFFDYFSPTQKEFRQVVAVTIEGTKIELIGFVIQELPEYMPDNFKKKDSVLVYMPMSYMIGGYAIFVPYNLVRPLNMNVEEAIRFTLTAGMSSRGSSSKKY